ncbi:Homocysteine S-methyltransferase ybgG [Cladochytrium replicatum]|nr:Homocysteine S-methyltransferase ybgG [Cladochytrium replicatum]
MIFMKNPLLQFNPLCLLDGGLATELEDSYGKDIKNDLWSASMLKEDPEAILQVHMDYLEAGADVLTTASYQATIPGLIAAGYSEEEGKALMVRSIELAVEARARFLESDKGKLRIASGRPSPLVAASLGSYGAYLANGAEFTGDYNNVTDEDLTQFYISRLSVFDQALPAHLISRLPADRPHHPHGIDILAFETVPTLQEARVLATLLASHASTLLPAVPAWISFSCIDAKHVCHGELFSDCVRETLKTERIVGVGINCTHPKYVESLLREGEKVYEDAKGSWGEKAFLCYPNSGEEWHHDTRSWRKGQAFEEHGGDMKVAYSAWAKLWTEAGARAIGGCCRTTPGHIHSLKSHFPHS